MSDLSIYPRQDKFETTLSQDISTGSVDIYLSSAPSFSLASGQYCEAIIDYDSSTKYERIRIGGPYTGGTTTISSSKITRGLPRYASGSSTEQTHSGGAKVIIGPSYADLENAATAINTKADRSGDTFTGPVSVTGTSSYVKVPNLTTAQRNALTASNGMVVYDTDLGNLYKYEGGAWSSFASGSVSNAADHTAGKVDIASATEIGANTAIDATSGAINVIPVSQTVKTSSGAGDENKLPVLNSSGQVAVGFLPANVQEANTVFGATDISGAELETLSSSSSSNADSLHTHAVFNQRISVVTADVDVVNTTTETNLISVSIPANTLGTGNAVRARIAIDVLKAASTTHTLTLKLKYGATTLVTLGAFSNFSAGTQSGYIDVMLVSAGTTGTQQGTLSLATSADEQLTNATATQSHSFGVGTATEDSTAAKTLAVSAQWNTANASTQIRAAMSIIEAIKG